MIEEEGRVVEISDGRLKIEITSPGACETCPVHTGCSSLGRTVRIPARAGIGVDDRVRLTIENASVLGVSLIVYGLPLLGMITGILLGELWFFRFLADDPKTLLSFALGVLLFASAGLLISRLDRAMKRRIRFGVVRRERDEDRPNGPSPS